MLHNGEVYLKYIHYLDFHDRRCLLFVDQSAVILNLLARVHLYNSTLVASTFYQLCTGTAPGYVVRGGEATSGVQSTVTQKVLNFRAVLPDIFTIENSIEDCFHNENNH